MRVAHAVYTATHAGMKRLNWHKLRPIQRNTIYTVDINIIISIFITPSYCATIRLTMAWCFIAMCGAVKN